MITLLRSTRSHLRTIRKEVLAESLNRGQRIHYLKDYFRWHLAYKYANHRWLIRFENGLQSYVYPYPDHDAGELNIWTRNVDYHDIEFIRQHLKPGDFIVDAGCNVGNRTWALADIIGGALLIDAGKTAIKRVRENIQLNQLPAEKYPVIEKAVGATPGTIYFSDLGGANTCNKVISVEDVQPQVPAIAVEMTTIDREIEKLGTLPVFIKTDVEGQDFAALQGATATLRSGTVRLVKFEHNRSEPLAPLLAFFANLDWQVFALNPQGEPTAERSYLESNMNLFAAPSSYYRQAICL